MEYLTPLEKMFPVIVPLVAEYLSIKDLAACCATSRTMRVLFDVDEVWKPRCVRGLVEYLKTTPCKVEPAFTSPESDNSTLDDVSEWRMAFMRENHLRNNWRQGRCLEELIKVHSDKKRMRPVGFISNDYLVVRTNSGFAVLDLSHSPPQHAVEPVTLDELRCPRVKVCNNRIIVCQYSLVLVYKADFLQKKCLLCNVFFYDEAFKEPLDKSYILKLSRKYFFFVNHCLVGEFFVALIEKESFNDTMVIWNYVTGEKMKEEHCPFKKQQICCSNSKVLVFHVYQEGRENTRAFIVYSLTKLAFLPFNVPVESSMTFYGCLKVATINNFMLIHIDDHCTIYNLETCKMLLSCECKQAVCYVMYDRFVFSGKDGVMKTFDPVTEILTVLPIDLVYYVHYTFDRYIQIQQNVPNTFHRNLMIFEIDRNFKIISKFSYSLPIYSTRINKAVSRCVVTRQEFLNVVSFW